MSRAGTKEAYAKYVEQNVVALLREYAESAEILGSTHWAMAMREAAKQLSGPSEHATQTNGEAGRSALKTLELQTGSGDNNFVI